jgi:hypothetical protein
MFSSTCSRAVAVICAAIVIVTVVGLGVASTGALLVFRSNSSPEEISYHREPLSLENDERRLQKTDLLTDWGAELLEDKKATPWPEYPRPQLRRREGTWLSLNGLWDYTVSTLDYPEGSDGLPTEREWVDGLIRVPFCVESKLSGVEKPLPLPRTIPAEEAPENIDDVRGVVLWYRRRFNLPPGVDPPLGSDIPLQPKRYFLRFEAVDYETAVW